MRYAEDPGGRLLGDEVLPAADRRVGDEHGSRVLVEQGPQAGQNRLDLFLGHDREDHHLATGIVEQQMAFVKAMMALAGYVVDDGVPGGPDPVQQVSGKLQVLALNYDLDFLHPMQR